MIQVKGWIRGIMLGAIGLLFTSVYATSIVDLQMTISPTSLTPSPVRQLITLTLTNQNPTPLSLNALKSHWPLGFSDTTDNCTGSVLAPAGVPTDHCTVTGFYLPSTLGTVTWSTQIAAEGYLWKKIYSQSLVIGSGLIPVSTVINGLPANVTVPITMKNSSLIYGPEEQGAGTQSFANMLPGSYEVTAPDYTDPKTLHIYHAILSNPYPVDAADTNIPILYQDQGVGNIPIIITISGDITKETSLQNVPVTLNGTAGNTISADGQAHSWGNVTAGTYTAGPTTFPVGDKQYILKNTQFTITNSNDQIDLEYDLAGPSAVAVSTNITGLPDNAAATISMTNGANSYGPKSQSEGVQSFAAMLPGSYNVTAANYTDATTSVTYCAKPISSVSIIKPTTIEILYGQNYCSPTSMVSATLTVAGDLSTDEAGVDVGTVTIANSTTQQSYQADVKAIANQAFPNSSTQIETGTYTVTAPPSVTANGTEYDLQPLSPVTMTTSNTNIILTYNKYVPPTPGQVPAGWDPDKITMATLFDNSQDAVNVMNSRPMVAAFNYTGQDGAGDKGQVVPIENSKIPQTIGALTNPLNTQYQTMPIFVVYTANASGGGLEGALPDIVNAGYLNDHYQTLIIYAKALETAYTNNGVRSTVILNPDFIGHIGQETSFKPDSVLPINDSGSGPQTQYNIQQVLNTALVAQGETIKVPTSLFTSSTLIQYMQSLNWIMGTFAPDIPYGWEDADWAGNVEGNWWLHHANPSIIATNVANETALIKQLGIFDPIPVTTVDGRNTRTYSQFLGFDKYGANPIFKGDSQFIDKGYLFNTQDWDNYMAFVSQVAKNLNTPLMLFQMPGAHLPENGDAQPFYNLATFPNYVFGSSSAGYDFNQFANIPGNIAKSVYYVDVANPGQYLLQQGQQVWQQNRLKQLHDDGVFAVVLGGGGYATGVWPETGPTFDDGGWLYNQITNNSDYIAQPKKMVPPDPQNLPVFPLNKSGASYEYVAGDQVTNNAKLCAYQCLYAKWCDDNTGTYGPPGEGRVWSLAWALLSPASATCLAPAPPN